MKKVHEYLKAARRWKSLNSIKFWHKTTKGFGRPEVGRLGENRDKLSSSYDVDGYIVENR